MTRPVFGDRETIENLDPRRAILNGSFDVPESVEICRFCGSPVCVSFDDTWISGDKWGAGTIEIECISEPDPDDEGEWESWMDAHEYDNQSDQMEDEAKIAKWLNKLYPGFENEC